MDNMVAPSTSNVTGSPLNLPNKFSLSLPKSTFFATIKSLSVFMVQTFSALPIASYLTRTVNIYKVFIIAANIFFGNDSEKLFGRLRGLSHWKYLMVVLWTWIGDSVIWSTFCN